MKYIADLKGLEMLVLSITSFHTKYSNRSDRHQLLKKQVGASTFSQDLHICGFLFDTQNTMAPAVFRPRCTAGRPVIKSKDLSGEMQK